MRDIYIAGKFEAQARLRRERDAIHAAGLGRVIGTWLDEEVGQAGTSAEQARGYAVRDMLEVWQADLFILDTFDDSNSGGREVEFGIALGREIQTWVVGPRRNVFHELAWQFYDWHDIRESLLRERKATA